MTPSVKEYLAQAPEEVAPYFNKLRDTILKNLPEGFVEELSYGNIGYVVPHNIYPDGYHCTPKLPLPFAGIALRKNSINLHHMGLYANPELLKWFKKEYPKHNTRKLDMGKSCIRFKKMDDIPYELIGQLMQKISVQDWIKMYENAIKRK